MLVNVGWCWVMRFVPNLYWGTARASGVVAMAHRAGPGRLARGGCIDCCDNFSCLYRRAVRTAGAQERYRWTTLAFSFLSCTFHVFAVYNEPAAADSHNL